MGWSERYWEDAKSDLERLKAEAEPAADDKAAREAEGGGAAARPALGDPASSPEGD